MSAERRARKRTLEFVFGFEPPAPWLCDEGRFVGAAPGSTLGVFEPGKPPRYLKLNERRARRERSARKEKRR